MSKETLDPSTLKRFPEDSITTRLGDQFMDEQVAIYWERKKKEAEKKSSDVKENDKK